MRSTFESVVKVKSLFEEQLQPGTPEPNKSSFNQFVEDTLYASLQPLVAAPIVEIITSAL